VRWLVKDPAVGTIAFAGIRGEYPEGASVSFTVNYEGGAGAGKTLSVSLVNGKGKTVAAKQFQPGKDAHTFVDFKNPGQGRYIVRAEVRRNNVVQDYAAESFEVSSAGEYGEPGSGEGLLKSLAQETGGAVIGVDDGELVKRIDVPEKAIKRIIGKKNYALWNSLATVALVSLLFGLEWFLRKRKGLM
jgi:hypothetical protein